MRSSENKKRSGWAFALVAILIFVLTGFRQSGQPTAQEPTAPGAEQGGCTEVAAGSGAARKLNLAGVHNFGEVTATLFRGAQPTAEGFAALHKQGIEIIVDFRNDQSEAEERLVEAQGMKWISLPWDCHHPNDEQVAQFLSLVRDHPTTKIFAHCRYGVDRTGMMIAAYRMAEQGWTAEQARQEMEKFGFDFIHSTWCHKLKTYEAGFPEKLANNASFQPVRTAFSPTISPCIK